MKIFQLTFLFLSSTFWAYGQMDKNKGKVFTSLEEALHQNPLRVYYLDLKQKNLKVFPREILQFKNLIHLNLAHNQLSSLEGIDFSELKDLEEIILYDNDFLFFPYEALDNAPNLITIDLGENDLKSIDQNLNQLRFIENIDLSGNRISFVGSDIVLPFLKSLNIERNYLNDFPGFVLQSGKMEMLNIYGNNIRNIPETINRISKLKHLNLGDNPLEEISKNIRLRKLQILILDWVDLSKESLNIQFIENSSLLETLSMEHCSLTEIPQEIFTLRKLKELSLLNNELVTINPDLSNNKKLSKVWVGGNRIDAGDVATIKQKMKKTEIINQ